MNRGEVYWSISIHSLAPKSRSVGLPSWYPGSLFNSKRRTVVVVPLSTAHTRTEWPLLIAVRGTGPAVAVIDQVKAADKARFGPKMGKLSDQEMNEISDALAFLLDLV